jgi:hypothetical protein
MLKIIIGPRPGSGLSLGMQQRVKKPPFSRRLRRREKQNKKEGVLAKTHLEIFVNVESFQLLEGNQILS